MQAQRELDDTAKILTLDLPVAPTVLIVDDDELVLRKLREMVEAVGYHVLAATNGAEALAILETYPASIVVTDLRMPGMDGLELCRSIRARSWSRYLYLVLLTARDEEQDVLAGLEAGADDYLSKRTSGAHFLARLRTAERILALEYSLKDALDQNRRMAMTDALTGVYNRRYFMRHFGRELKRSQRYGGDVALLLLDVDHFKLVNDNFGHGVGDVVLQRLTREIAACLRRSTDWCARIGGEEFAVVLEGTNLMGARRCAEMVRDAIANALIDTSGGVVRVTVSIGIAVSDDMTDKSAATVQLLLEQADANLYKSKASGRNCVSFPNACAPRNEIRRTAKNGVTHANAQMPVSSIR